MSFKKELDAEVERLKKQAKPKLRYRNGYRLEETMRLYCPPMDPTRITIRMSHDLLRQLWHWRDKWAKPDEPIPKHVEQTMRMEFVRFEAGPDGGIPGCLMRLEQPYHYAPFGVRIHRVQNAWTYQTTVTHKKIGVKPGIASRTLDFLPWEDMGGYILMFEQEDMDYLGPIQNPDLFRRYAKMEIDDRTKKRDWL